jgi:disulfide bond formation protein DsbB
MGSWIRRNILTIAWAQALVATFGSLYFSEVMKFIPCTLCWYQRIFMYPLLFVLATGISIKDQKLYKYVFPLSIAGWFIALYHNLVYYGLIKEASVLVCVVESPCDLRYINWLGFVGIPLLSFVAFTVINVCMIVYKKETKRVTL